MCTYEEASMQNLTYEIGVKVLQKACKNSHL